MRKILGRVVLLCLACVLCMQGLCLAENWVQYGYNPGGMVTGTLLVDVDSVHTVDCKGRRFLLARNRQEFPGYPSYGTFGLFAFDLENNTSLKIESGFEATGVTDRCDISLLISGEVVTFDDGERAVRNPADNKCYPIDMSDRCKKMLQTIKQYRPDVVQAVLAYNANNGQGSNAGVGKKPANIGNIQPHLEYTVLDSGAVCLGEDDTGEELAYWYLYRVPKSLGFPMAFATGYRTDGTTTVRTVVENVDRYDYDPSTNTLIVCGAYQWDGAVYWDLFRVLDNNTVYQEYLVPDFNYAGDIKPLRKKIFAPIIWRFDGQQWIGTDSEDGSPTGGRQPLYSEFSDSVPPAWPNMEMALLFASLHGNIGELPEEYEIEPKAAFVWAWEVE